MDVDPEFVIKTNEKSDNPAGHDQLRQTALDLLKECHSFVLFVIPKKDSTRGDFLVGKGMGVGLQELLKEAVTSAIFAARREVENGDEEA